MMIQKKTIPLQAWCLGENSPVERRLLQKGLLARGEGDTWLLYSRETRQEPQVAHTGDYFKVDGGGMPYPNSREFFLAQHTHVEGDWYLQNNPPVMAWTADDPVSPEIQWLLSTGRLTIQPGEPERYFGAFLWGAQLWAARDALVVLRQVKRDEQGNVEDLEFYFLAREEFLRTYDTLPQEVNP